MASPSKVHLNTAEKPEFALPGITEESAKKASELLQENHDRHHIFFNQSGFHNHIAHHLLTIYALGATPEVIQKQYDRNKGYQRPAVSLDDSVVSSMHDPTKFSQYLGDEKYYRDWLVFFRQEMEAKGWQNVLNEYLFARDKRADDMLCRMFAGFLHPIIHLGFGIEFDQPAIMAEAMAQAAVHADYMGKLLLKAEEAAKDNGKVDRTLVSLLDDIRADEKLSTAAHWDDGNKLRDGILVRAPEEMIKYASQFVVTPETLDEKTAEMTNAVAYYTGGAQHPPKQVKYDFYYMHCVNNSIFYTAFNKQDWLKTEDKVRLLEWKGRNDLAMYASRRSPKPLLEEIVNYKPNDPSSTEEKAKQDLEPWHGIFERVVPFEDDGHGAKLVRALAHGQVICKPYEDRESFRIKHDAWLQLGHMAIDSVQDDGDTWVRSAGFDEAWEKFSDRPKEKL